MSEPDGQGAERRVYSAGDVARRLGVSSAGLRRLAGIYEGVYGKLPRDPRAGRVWDDQAIERLAAARELVERGRAASVEAALRGQERTVLEEATPAQPGRVEELLEGLIGEVRELRASVERLEDENRELRAALPAPTSEATEPRESPAQDQGHETPTEYADGTHSGAQRREHEPETGVGRAVAGLVSWLRGRRG